MTGQLSVRDRRIVLGLAGAAAVWRWLVAIRTPLPGVDACVDLWRAQQLAGGSMAALAEAWWEPWWSLLLAPAIAFGAPPLLAAKAAACACGALTVVVVAMAAERLRESAGVGAAVLATVAAGPVVAAGAGSGVALTALIVAFAAHAFAAGRGGIAAVLVVVAAATMGDRILATTHLVREVRLGIGAAVPMALFALLPPRPRPVLWGLGVLTLVLAASTVVAAPSALVPAWSPIAAVLAGVGLARLPVGVRDVALCAAVAVECHGAWREIEPDTAAAERVIGRIAAHRITAEERVVSDLPRVLWAAGQRPVAVSPDRLLELARDPSVAMIVVGWELARNATLTASLSGDFAHFESRVDVREMLAVHGLLVLVRRRRS